MSNEKTEKTFYSLFLGTEKVKKLMLECPITNWKKKTFSFFFSNNANGHRGNGAVSDNDSDDDAEEGDYTVYECPGLAPVKLFLLCNEIKTSFSVSVGQPGQY